MKKLYDEVRGRIVVQLMRICNPETTISDVELVLTEIERILIDEKVLK